MEYTEKKRWPLFGLPLTFTQYVISEELITERRGAVKRVEDDCYTYKIMDVRLENSLLERLFGLGTIHCFGGDLTHPELVIRHVRHSRDIKNFILKSSEEQRQARKIINTVNIGGGREAVDRAAADSCETPR